MSINSMRNFSRIAVVSDFQDGNWTDQEIPSASWFRNQWLAGSRGNAPFALNSTEAIEVRGGYLERLPLAVLKAGLVQCAEIWSHWRGNTPPSSSMGFSPLLTRRAFRLNGLDPPFASNDMLGHIEAYGPPKILCVWGLGVDEDIMASCRDSIKIYNSIDAPALRVPFHVSRHFDLILTGAQWQSDVVLSRHPHVQTAIMPIGPEFASDLTFTPLNLPKTYDVIYVAAAQPYKRHDILFAALERLPRSIRALCVCGYGEMIEDLHRQVTELGINVDFVDPPGVSFDEVNRLMNQARLGVVCGIDDGAPAILTEYMLAGIPVLANSRLTCGLQYITPLTGRTATAEYFDIGIREMLDNLDQFTPRDVVLANWSWAHSVRKLERIIKSLPRWNLS